MQEKGNKFDEALESLIQAKAILEDNYGVVDKRTTRVKRNISLIRLKLGMIPDALQEMKEVEVSQKSCYRLSLITIILFFFRNWRRHCTETAPSILQRHAK